MSAAQDASIPLDVADLTPEWFSSALAAHRPGVEVATVEVLDAHSGTTGRAKLRLAYRGDAGDLPATVFCKLAPFDERQRQFLRAVGIGVMEARFYAELAAGLPVRLPRAWHATAGGDGAFVMVLEDLDAAGCTFPRPSDPDIAERAASTVEELARLHAAHWEDPRFDGDLAWVPDRAGFGGDAVSGARSAASLSAAARFTRRALEQFAADMPPAFAEIGALYSERVGDILDLWDLGERTLIHGDPHSGNLFTDGARTGFYDWAMFSHSPGPRDVAYYCCNSIPTEVRRAIEPDLLARYRETLAASGIDVEPGGLEQQYRLFAVFAWVSASSTAAVGDRWQPSHRAVAAMRRTTDAIADLDSIGLLRSLLS